jgi:hypothetical protein
MTLGLFGHQTLANFDGAPMAGLKRLCGNDLQQRNSTVFRLSGRVFRGRKVGVLETFSIKWLRYNSAV